MKNITGKRSVKAIAAFFITIMMWDIIFPAAALALTGGPSQPEVQSFEPVGTTEMVDLFSGDFVYNIPLVDVEGFPINISYHSGVGMDDEASWVGLGWNINPGVINRNMRGIPDDFQGDQVKTTTNIKENQTWGANINANLEIFGIKNISKKQTLNLGIGASLGVFYNNYRGLGAEFGLNPSLSVASKSKPTRALTLGLNFDANSQQGADIGTRLSFSHDLSKNKEPWRKNLSFGLSANSRHGADKLTFGYGASKKVEKTIKNGNRADKNTTINAGTGFNGGFSLNPNTYTPQINNELKNVSVNLSFSAGAEGVGFYFSGGYSGYFQTQFLKNRVRYNDAYGYLYAHDALDGENPGGNVMYDLNRENDGTYTKGKPYLPIPIYTYDMFSVAGEGTGGLIRPFRSDVGVMTDATTKNTTVGVGLGLEFGAGNAFKVGADLSGNYGYTRSGMWRYNNQSDFDIVKYLNFNKPASASSFEPAYFRRTGELTKANNDIYSELKDNYPVRIIVENNPHGRLSSTIIDRGGGQKNITKKLKQNSRQARNMTVSMLTNKEASKVGLNRNIKIYEQNVFEIEGKTIKPDTVILRETDGNFKSKMSELTVTNPDGRRYVYDLPAYNNFQYDAAFRVVDVANPSSLVKDRSTGLVQYNAGDNSTGNGRGEDNFYTKNELPAYAHSFLLTSILSPDYVDITGNGVSDDDIGTAVKINYTRAYKNFRWRTPFGNGTREANYDEGLKSDIYDDRGNYIYGEKEIWYTHSIESKNYVACFYTSQRNDGHGVLDEDGGIDATKSFYKLDSIKLFTKKELELNGTSATPLKTVHFEYDYSLCLNAQNNENYDTTSSAIQEATGKLTLKKIYFTYGNSRKGRTNSYQFTYSDFNPIYNLRGYDRWGNYKPNPTNAQMGNIDDVSTPLSNVDDPYVLQNKDSADLYASAWSLTSIKLPSGGTINVNYESDDYAYIQDKQAGQMFKVVGINSSNTFKNDASNLFETTSNKNFIFFDLEEPISKSASAEEIENKKNDYIGGNEKIYFKFLVDLTGDGDYEYVSGYADKLQVGFQSRNPTDTIEYDLGYIELEEVALQKSGFEKINPISKASWNFMRLYAPKKLAKIFSGYEPPPASTNPIGVAKSLVGSVSEMLNMVRSFGKRMRAKGAGQKFVFNKSFIRLNNPSKTKYGGGVRVKQVSLSDDWDNMVSGQETSSYGQNYIYTKQEKQADGTYKTISSGVATWEPSIGGDENSHKQPAEYTQSNTLAPDDQYMVELPIGESLYPAPSVGYSQVTTINIKPSENIKRTATGKVVNEFYTAKDFPVITSSTEVDNQPRRNRPSFLSQLLKVYVKDKAFVSQGYSIELNDMHGKPKAQWVYEEDNNVPISGVKYHYNYKINEQGKNQLISKVDVVNPDGSITSAEMGRENDFMFDMRNNYSFHAGATLQGNLDAFLASILPVVVPSIFSNLSIQELEFGSAVNTKVIMRYGILKETEVFENGATVKTQNVLFDSETGDVLLAKTTNEFDDTIYTFNYPAHFAYEGMGQAYKNIGYYFKDIKLIDGELHNLSNYTDFIFPGDELYVETEVGGSTDISYIKLWAVESPHYAGELIFLTRTGAPYSTANITGEKYNLKIVRSGRRNMQSTSIGSVVSLNNPVVNGTLSFDSIINSGAVEFTDYWSTEHKYVYEDLSTVPSTYQGVGSPPQSLGQPRGACNDECYNAVMDLLMSFSGTYTTMLNAEIGDTINLMEAPYRDDFLCAIGQNQICNQFDVFNEIGDSLLIYDGQEDISTASIYTPSIFQDEIKYASINNDLYNHVNKNNHGPSDNGVEDIIGEEALSLFPKSTSYTGCDPCEQIRYRDSYKRRKFKLRNGCELYVVVQCIDGDKDPNQCVNYPDATKLNCNIQNGNLLHFETTIKTLGSSSELSTRYNCDRALVYTEKYCPNPFGGEPPLDICDTCDTCTSNCGGGTGIIKECRDSICDEDLHLIPVNPYVYGTRGNWRPKRNWLFYDKRNQATTSNIRKDGTYKNYVDFWKKPVMTGGLWDTGSSVSSKWVWNTEVTKFNRTGNEIENKDALDIYSAALFGYGQSMVSAVGNNSKLRQLAYEGFEDFGHYTNQAEDHFSFYKYSEVIDENISHTGVYSLPVDSSSEKSVRKCVIYSENEVEDPITDTSFNLIMLKPTELVDKFSPDSGSYIISTWVKENTTTPQFEDYEDTVVVKIYQQNCITTYKFTPSGPIIEGWQRVEGKFTVSDSATCIEFVLKAGTQGKAYFDDFRVHPWNGNMKSFVYHPLTLRLMAELDENNYATFYEYDDEGRLVRIKRETERGIVTLQESRTGLKINEE